MDTNIEYNTTYSIYDVKQIDNIKLLKIHKLNWSKIEWTGNQVISPSSNDLFTFSSFFLNSPYTSFRAIFLDIV
jgi:hypothetical protein